MKLVALSSRGDGLGRVYDTQIDFVHAGVANSLQYHWTVDGGRGADSNMRYIYSPGLGMVYVQGED